MMGCRQPTDSMSSCIMNLMFVWHFFHLLDTSEDFFSHSWILYYAHTTTNLYIKKSKTNSFVATKTHWSPVQSCKFLFIKTCIYAEAISLFCCVPVFICWFYNCVYCNLIVYTPMLFDAITDHRNEVGLFVSDWWTLKKDMILSIFQSLGHCVPPKRGIDSHGPL